MLRRALLWMCIAALPAAIPAAVAPPAASAAAFGERTLSLRAQGRDVRVLQRLLTRLGHRTAVDGYFGRRTRRSVRRYERREDLKVDGRVSPIQARGMRKRVRARRRAERERRRADAQARESEVPLGYTDGDEAVIGPDGRRALAPRSAPQAVKDAIAAANRIVDKPYRYGGGHGDFEDSAYDCSGAVSYVLHGAGRLRRPRASSGFERYGDAGKGEWITVYANSGHAYIIVAGLRFDTSGRGEDGPRWRPEPRSSRGYTKRHPAGL